MAGDGPSLTRTPQGWARWTWATGAAEAIGLGVAAAAAGVGFQLFGEPDSVSGAAGIVTLAVLGGAVEGAAVGSVQSHFLRHHYPLLRVRRYITVSALAAAACWYVGMLPSTLVSLLQDVDEAATSSTQGPQLLVMALGGMVLGGVLGAALGAAQAWVLVGAVARPARWVTANVVGWAIAMVVIMVGASIPDDVWPLALLLLLGAMTGLFAGLVVGAVTGACVVWIDDTVPTSGSWWNRFVLFLLRSPAHRLLSSALVELTYVGRRSGLPYALPVQFAQSDEVLVVCPGNADVKTWWRNFVEPREAEVVLEGIRTSVVVRCVTASEHSDHQRALEVYRRRFHRARVSAADPMIVVSLRPVRQVRGVPSGARLP